VSERLAFGALGFGYGVPELPESLGLSLVRGDDGIADDALSKSGREQALELGDDVYRRIGGRAFDQCVPGMLA